MTEPLFVGVPRFREPALCAQADPEEWFPEKGGSTRAAKAVCNGGDGRPPCPARPECLAWALGNAEAGVWGGLSERERLRLRSGGRLRCDDNPNKSRRIVCPDCALVLRADALARHRRIHERGMAS